MGVTWADGANPVPARDLGDAGMALAAPPPPVATLTPGQRRRADVLRYLDGGLPLPAALITGIHRYCDRQPAGPVRRRPLGVDPNDEIAVAYVLAWDDRGREAEAALREARARAATAEHDRRALLALAMLLAAIVVWLLWLLWGA